MVLACKHPGLDPFLGNGCASRGLVAICLMKRGTNTSRPGVL